MLLGYVSAQALHILFLTKDRKDDGDNVDNGTFLQIEIRFPPFFLFLCSGHVDGCHVNVLTSGQGIKDNSVSRILGHFSRCTCFEGPPHKCQIIETNLEKLPCG